MVFAIPASPSEMSPSGLSTMREKTFIDLLTPLFPLELVDEVLLWDFLFLFSFRRVA